MNRFLHLGQKGISPAEQIGQQTWVILLLASNTWSSAITQPLKRNREHIVLHMLNDRCHCWWMGTECGAWLIPPHHSFFWDVNG